VKAAVNPLTAPARLTAKDRAAVVTALRARLGSSWSSIGQLGDLLAVKVRRLPGWPVEVAVKVKDKARSVVIAADLTPDADRAALANGLAIVVLIDAQIACVDADYGLLGKALLEAEVQAIGAAS
jgi:hypothetical protein